MTEESLAGKVIVADADGLLMSILILLFNMTRRC